MTDDPLASWARGAATGLGPMPGTSYDEAARIVAGETPDLPAVPSLPARGVGADPVGEVVSLLVDIPAEVVPSGWRISRRPGVDQRRALDQRRWVTDAVEAQFVGAGRVKVQVTGPWTLAAELELGSGNRALTDPAAVDDLAASLVEGLRDWLAELTRRTGAGPVVQLDEPRLTAVLAGAVPTASGFGTIRAQDPSRVGGVLAGVVGGLGVPVVVRAGPGAPLTLICRTGVAGLAVDLTAPTSAELDALGEALEAGVVLLAGTVPTAPSPRSRPLRDHAGPLLEACRRWGFRLPQVADLIVPTPVDGLADVTAADATRALRLSRDIARALPDPPDDW